MSLFLFLTTHLISMEVLNFSAYRGDSWSGKTLQINLNGVPLNLTGASVLMQLKKSGSDDVSAFEFSTANGRIFITNPTTTGFFTINETVINIIPREYVYDMQITLASGKVVTPIGGKFTIESDVSR